MFCPNCGKKLEDDVKFCMFCGKRIKSTFRQNDDVEIGVVFEDAIREAKSKGKEWKGKIEKQIEKNNWKKNKRISVIAVMALVASCILIILLGRGRGLEGNWELQGDYFELGNDSFGSDCVLVIREGTITAFEDGKSSYPFSYDIEGNWMYCMVKQTGQSRNFTYELKGNVLKLWLWGEDEYVFRRK